jgi:RNA polymerase sigma-70 factor, ECF subfamily
MIRSLDRDGDRVIDIDGDERRWSQYMAAAHKGDSRLYERLLRELATVIEAYICSRFGRLAFTEDCVQECLLAIHRARHTYDPARPFRPWLFAVVRNKTVDLLRRSYTDARTPQERPGRTETAPDPRAEIEAGEVLAGLKPEFRNALMLTKVIGYSIVEAAERSGISETAMKSRVRRAVRAAETLLREERGNE